MRYRTVIAATGLVLLGCSDDASPPDAAPDLPVDVGSNDRSMGDAPPDLAVDQPVDLPPPDAPCPDPGVTIAPGIVVSPTNLSGQATVTYGPPAALAGSANLTLHHAFNFWDLALTAGAALDTPMTHKPDGTFEATVTLPAAAHLLDFVFFTQGATGKQWDNNAGEDYHRSVGVPYIGPYLTLRDNLTGTPPQPDRDPARSVMVSFVTDHPCQGRVRYGTSASALPSAMAESASGTHHHLVLTALAPDTVHHYQVSCIDPAVSCPLPQIAPIFSFRTARQSPSDVTFAVLSDPQDNRSANEHWKDVAQILTQPPHDDARFVLITGDLTGDDLPQRWWDFFDKGRALFASRPLVPAVGNHDTPGYTSSATAASFDALFDFDSSSGSDLYHALVHGPLTLLVLNSETSQVAPADWKPGGAQYGWVASALAQTKTPWRFAAWHIPPYNTGTRHSGQGADTRPMTALFDDKVDWVFCGHEHLYQRFKPLRFATSGPVATVVPSYGGPGGGVGYLVAPVGGHDPPESSLLGAADPLRSMLASPAGSEIAGDSLVNPFVGFVKVTVSGKSFQLTTHALGQTTPRDQVSYTRP